MVANNGDEPLKAMVYSSNVVYDEEGLPSYEKPTGEAAEFLKSPASWLTVRMPTDTQLIANTPFIELDPGEEIELNYEMNVPDQAAPGDYNAVIFFEMFDTSESGAGATSKVAGRIGARVIVRVAGEVVEKIEVAPFWVRSLVIGNTAPYSFTVSNKGNVDKRYQPFLVVLDTAEREVMRSEVETSAIVYAGNAREYSGGLTLEGVSFGQYIMRTEIVFDKETEAASAALEDSVAKDRTFWVIPLWLVIAMIVVVALPLLWLSYRASTKSRRRATATATAKSVEGGDASGEA